MTLADLLSPEAEKFLRNSTTGSIPEYNDKSNLHKGPHISYTDAVRNLNNNFIGDNHITSSNKMTLTQAQQLNQNIQQSANPIIRQLLDNVTQRQHAAREAMQRAVRGGRD